MRAGSPESFVYYVALLIGFIIAWVVLLRLLKLKSMALSFVLGYLSLVAFAMIKGWQPLDPHGLTKQASEVVTLSWPAVMLERVFKLKSHMAYIVIAAAALQYCIAGWIVDILLGSIFGKDR